MRRKRINCGCLSSLRNGVIASVMATKRSVQSPVACSRNCVGLEPNPPVKASQMSTPAGTRQSRNTTAFVHLLVSIEFMTIVRLIVFLQIHAVVHAGDLIAVAVEHLCRGDFEKSWQAHFFGL